MRAIPVWEYLKLSSIPFLKSCNLCGKLVTITSTLERNEKIPHCQKEPEDSVDIVEFILEALHLFRSAFTALKKT